MIFFSRLHDFLLHCGFVLNWSCAELCKKLGLCNNIDIINLMEFTMRNNINIYNHIKDDGVWKICSLLKFKVSMCNNWVQPGF